MTKYWCKACEHLQQVEAGDDAVCEECGDMMVAVSRLSAAEREFVRYGEWCREVRQRGEWGPSPGGAAGELGCTRPMIDYLVRMGVLIRNEYDAAEGYTRTVIISEKSIKEAKENRVRTGNWTGGSKKKS